MLDWDHNAYYHRLLLGLLPPDCRRVLDIGCGAGAFATRLAGRVEQVDAVDRSAAMVETAEQRTPDNLNCILADVLTDPLPGGYDAVVSICALHHMPLREALPRCADLLRPGGVLAAIALPRADLPRELPTEVAAAVGHRLLGAGFATARAVGRNDWFAKGTAGPAMPVVMNPELTTREVAAVAASTLPGTQVRRLLFWRYLLTWHKPA